MKLGCGFFALCLAAWFVMFSATFWTLQIVNCPDPLESCAKE